MEIDVQHQANRQGFRQPNQASSDKMQAWIPTKNPASLVSYYAGILGLIPVLGMPATITALVAGVVALKKYKQNPTPGAKVHAVIGLVLGGVQFIIFLIVIGSIVFRVSPE